MIPRPGVNPAPGGTDTRQESSTMRQCSECDTVNDPAEAACMVCDTPFPPSRVRINLTGRNRPAQRDRAGR